MPVGFKKLSQFPRNRLIDADLVRCHASELDLLGAFGPPTLATAASEPEPLFFWDIEWSCGLVMSLRLDQLTEELVVRLSEPDVDHALRHLPFGVRDLAKLEDDDPEAFAKAVPDTGRGWELWEAEGAKGRRTIATGLTEKDAQCRALELDPEAAGRVGIAPAAPVRTSSVAPGGQLPARRG